MSVLVFCLSESRFLVKHLSPNLLNQLDLFSPYTLNPKKLYWIRESPQPGSFCGHQEQSHTHDPLGCAGRKRHIKTSPAEHSLSCSAATLSGPQGHRLEITPTEGGWRRARVRGQGGLVDLTIRSELDLLITHNPTQLLSLLVSFSLWHQMLPNVQQIISCRRTLAFLINWPP